VPRRSGLQGRAAGIGNPILYVGSRTGRDGIHGATMASESFDEESEAKRPTVQVGDPFTEKVLLEACLEAMRAAPWWASRTWAPPGSPARASRWRTAAGTGIELELERVPLREPALTPYEIMLSESQERMVLVAERGREEEVREIFERWGLQVVPIGRGHRVGTRHSALRRRGGGRHAGAPAHQAPVYERPVREPSPSPPLGSLPECEDPAAALVRLLSTPDLGDKSWIWSQYDSTVRTNTVIGPGGDAALLRLKGTPSGLALTSDVNPVYCALDPREGGRQAVAEAARNLACVGAEPAGLTDCLNFGNPERPEIAWQLRECIRGMAEACRVLGVPVVSGNVSLYNETEGRSIHPTPTVAMVGLVEELPADAWATRGASFAREGDRVVLLGADRRELGGSAFLRLLHDLEAGSPPRVDLAAEARLGELLRRAHAQGLLAMAHDVSDGGLAVALAEACLGRGLGARVTVDADPLGLFSESQGRALVAVPPRSLDALLALAEATGVAAVDAGEVGGDRLVVRHDGGTLDVAVDDLHRVWSTALPRALEL
jgi:phosphoribosylformylglycinamidine synthase subunit PurL